MRNIIKYNDFDSLYEHRIYVKQKPDVSLGKFNKIGPMIIDNYDLKYNGNIVGVAYINMNNEGKLALREITINNEHRNEGIGTKFMEQLCKLADTEGWTIVLTPDSYKGSSKARLIDFYTKFGFVENKGRKIDYSISETMYREPTNANESYNIPNDTRDHYLKTNKKIASDLELRTDGDYVMLYHGTSTKNMKEIIKTGMIKSGTWLAPDIEVSQRYSKMASTGNDKGMVDTMFVYMGSIIFNDYFSTQEDLYRKLGGFYSPKDI